MWSALYSVVWSLEGRQAMMRTLATTAAGPRNYSAIIARSWRSRRSRRTARPLRSRAST